MVVERKCTFYVMILLVPLFLVATLGFGSFAVPAEEVADRLSVTLALLLTVVAFKLTTSELTPQVAYVHLLDSYVLASLIFLVLVTLENVGLIFHFCAPAAAGG